MSDHKQVPLIPRPEQTFSDVCPEPDPMVGCRCIGGRVYLNGIMPACCEHCGGRGVLPRSRYRELFEDAA